MFSSLNIQSMTTQNTNQLTQRVRQIDSHMFDQVNSWITWRCHWWPFLVIKRFDNVYVKQRYIKWWYILHLIRLFWTNRAMSLVNTRSKKIWKIYTCLDSLILSWKYVYILYYSRVRTIYAIVKFTGNILNGY